MKEAVIVAGARTAVGRAPRGTLRASRPDDMAGAAIAEALRRAGGLDPAEVEDVLLGCAITTLSAISLMRTVSGDGIARLLGTLAMFFSGSIVPLPLLPDWAQPVLDFMPFRGLMDLPFRFYMGHLPPSEIWAMLAHQLAWTLAFVLTGRVALARGLRRLTVQGG